MNQSDERKDNIQRVIETALDMLIRADGVLQIFL